MILKFEHRVLFGFWFQNDVYINMDNVNFIEVLRTRIRFFGNRSGYYWIPRTEKNMQVLEGYLCGLKQKSC